MTRLLQSAEEALMRRLRKGLSVERQFQLFGALDRLGAWPQRITAGPARGLQLVAPISRRTSYCNGSHEPHVMAALEALVPSGGVVLDVGSHLGHFALALSRLVGPAGHVYSFEPLPAHAALLRQTVALNHLENVTVVPAAIGATRGEALMEEWQYGALSRILVGAPALAGRKLHRVPVTTLDAWCDATGGVERLDVIKLDTEGYELAALRGACEVVARYRPAFICELHYTEDSQADLDAILAWFQAAEYEVTALPPTGCYGTDVHQALDWCRTRRLAPGAALAFHIRAIPRERGKVGP